MHLESFDVGSYGGSSALRTYQVSSKSDIWIKIADDGTLNNPQTA
jgi:hypothetical protein